jgi:hypothetical protein
MHVKVVHAVIIARPMTTNFLHFVLHFREKLQQKSDRYFDEKSYSRRYGMILD